MLVSTQRSFSGQDIVFHALNLISEYLNKYGNALMPLISTEDTTENGDQGQLQIARYNGNDIRGAVKAVFWIAISISIALLMGRLC